MFFLAISNALVITLLIGSTTFAAQPPTLRGAVPVGGCLNRDRSVWGYYPSSDLQLYKLPNKSSPLVYRDSNFKWQSVSEHSSDASLIAYDWEVLELRSDWVKVKFQGHEGWIDGRLFFTPKLVVYNKSGKKIQEFLSPLQGAPYTLRASDKPSHVFVSSYKHWFLEVNLQTGCVSSRAHADELISRGLVQKEYVYSRLAYTEAERAHLKELGFNYGTFRGRFRDPLLYYLEDERLDNPFGWRISINRHHLKERGFNSLVQRLVSSRKKLHWAF